MFNLRGGRLRAQSIKKLCQPTRFFGLVQQQPMLVPFSQDKVRVNGKSKGLSAASYDVSIDHDLVLGPDPGHVWLEKTRHDLMPTSESPKWKQMLADALLYPSYSLAYTVEDFYMPHNVSADVADKSTYARFFVSAFNTFIDPGFHGNLTLELVNKTPETIYIKKGDPICQIIFTWTDGKTDRPYNGKYAHQKKGAVGARLESDDGTSYIEKKV